MANFNMSFASHLILPNYLNLLMNSKHTSLRFILFVASLIVVSSCQKGVQDIDDILKRAIQVEVNPYEKVPLGAMLAFETRKPCKVEITVQGKIPVNRSFNEYRRTHNIPVIGLYPDTTNLVSIILTDKNEQHYEGEIEIASDALPDLLPEIDIVKLDRSKMEPGFHLAELLIANNGLFHSYTIMFDDHGTIRWFMDMSSTEKISYSPLRLRNGNWLYVSWIDIYELNELGKVIRKDQMWGHAGDHDIIELPNGNLLMGGSKKDASVIRERQKIGTRYDYVIEWERKSPGRTVREWDLGEVLDIDRSVFPADYSMDNKADWFHINSINYNESDNSLLASGRNQGVVKFDGQKNLKWILSPHKAWGASGREGKGEATKKYLLTAVDASGKPYGNDVQEGLERSADFEWSTGQHAISVLDNGNIVLFDNGLSRNFNRTPTYSRAVEYKIDEDAMTIQQVWEYGRDKGLDMFSGITSDVDILPETGNRLITAGNVRLGKLPPHAKMLEVSYPGNEEVFEANLFFKDASGSKEQSWAQFDLVYRGERYDLFPKKM